MNPTESLSFSRAKIAARGSFWISCFSALALSVAVWQMWGSLDKLRADLATARDEIVHVRRAAQADYDANAWWKDTCHTYAYEDRRATDAKVKRLEARIETMEADIESTKRVQDLWDQLTLDDINDQARKVAALEKQVADVASEVAKPGEILWRIKVNPLAEMSVVSVPCTVDTTLFCKTDTLTNSTTTAVFNGDITSRPPNYINLLGQNMDGRITVNGDVLCQNADGGLARKPTTKFNACLTGAVCR